jgi:hypothetical protein
VPILPSWICDCLRQNPYLIVLYWPLTGAASPSQGDIGSDPQVSVWEVNLNTPINTFDILN